MESHNLIKDETQECEQSYLLSNLVVLLRLCSHQTVVNVVRQLSGSRQAFVSQLSDSHQAIIIQLLGRCQFVKEL